MPKCDSLNTTSCTFKDTDDNKRDSNAGVDLVDISNEKFF